MTEPMIACPKCHAEIKLTESLAAPIIASTRQLYEEKIAQKDNEIAKREQAVLNQEKEVAVAKKLIEDEVASKVGEQLKSDRTKIAAEEAKKAKLAIAVDLEQKDLALQDLQEVLKIRDIKLAEAQKAQAELIKKQRELDDAKRELELTVDRSVSYSPGYGQHILVFEHHVIPNSMRSP